MGLTTLSKQLVAAEHGTKKAQGAFRDLRHPRRDVHKASAPATASPTSSRRSSTG
jgi:hypothetical protein